MGQDIVVEIEESLVETKPAAVLAAAVSGRVDTRRARRRMVAFSSLAEVSADLEKIEAARAAGRLARLGNHEAGPIFLHLSLPMKGSFDGIPDLGSWWNKILGRALKKRILAQAFRPGFRLRAADEKLAWDDSVSFEAGLAALREQMARATLAAMDARAPQPRSAHPFFGAMTPADWQAYYLRHAELHLSFLRV